jgi:hypothetical protein
VKGKQVISSSQDFLFKFTVLGEEAFGNLVSLFTLAAGGELAVPILCPDAWDFPHHVSARFSKSYVSYYVTSLLSFKKTFTLQLVNKTFTN